MSYMTYNNNYGQGNYGGYNPYPSYPYMNPQQRLQAMEQQYPQYGQTSQLMPQLQPQQGNTQSQSPIMAVKSEQQARDYPLDLSGSPQIFVMDDDSKIFAKRFNVSNGLAEFEVYERSAGQAPTPTSSSMPDNSVLLGIVGDFTAKLENLYAEIQALRKDVQHGYQPNVDCKPTSKQKSSNATNNATSTTDDADRK